ncbi:M23 family metallopeptidase [Nocardioides pantholopis]|uniref:M23 family metallopeptidase n=1 Tax=Nocardioides pantholopis TaxID=2483798 RepID=UPI000FDBA28D|nr:M23 family metallopeptidase [Nocardioides pantholopis]
MRFFPSASRPRLAAVTLACALATGSAAVPLAHADDDLKKRQHQVEKQVEAAHDELEHSSAQARRATRRLEVALGKLRERRAGLASARAQVQAARAVDISMREKLAAAEQALVEASAAVVAGQKAVAEQRRSVVDTVTTIYQDGDPRMMALSSILDSADSTDLIRRTEVGDVLVNREAADLDKLRATEVLLRVREDRVEKAKVAVAEQRAAAAAHLREMAQLRDAAAQARAEVRTYVVQAKSVREVADRARERDQAVLARLERQEQTIRAKILAQARRAGAGYRGKSGGFFDHPVAGSVTSPYGYRKHPIYGYWGLHDGTDFGAACGTPLHAVATGTVASKYFSAVYGNRLYLNVGNVNGRFITAVYNHATHYTVGPGDRVRRGQVIGYVGSTGWSTGCHLHFTTLANGDTTNPMNYL